jgi:hypothetical protein
MTVSLTVRRLAAALLAVVLGFAALPGCGSSAPQAKDDKKDEKKEIPAPTPGPTPTPTPTPKPPEGPPKSTLGAVEKAADDAATAFRRDLVMGTAKAEMLSASFLKAIGKPAVLPSDKAKGYSADVATSWLKKVGASVNFGPELKREQAGDVAYLRGALQKPGGYCLRMVKEGGAWKVDWLSITSVDNASVTTTPTPEGAAQGFAVAAFIETIADKDTMPTEDRHLLVAAAMTADLRKAWSPLVFDQDKNAGYDYGPAKLNTEAVKIGGKTNAYTASRVGDLPEFRVELTKPEGKKAYTVRLVKGATPHEWLVSEVVEAK